MSTADDEGEIVCPQVSIALWCVCVGEFGTGNDGSNRYASLQSLFSESNFL